ncbi:hypothetical protein H5410_055721 [Solanum commersonii]|uniref:Uncharacterized protein n=1 Tax=Solanum commersonii TaxID=4109 RepID=A0A9J5WIB6_SOLCO|nr:hypothetical protein H5410_055721 [Solanum commersonii]
MINRKKKSLEDVMRGLCGFDSSQSVRYEELCTFPEVELPPANAFVDHYKFHVEITPDRTSITKLKPKSTKCFQEYAIHWRKDVARVHPYIEESEMITYFIQAQDSEYYEQMVTMGGKTFAEIMKAGKMIEDGLNLISVC